MRVVLLRPAIGEYRRAVLEILAERLGGGLAVYAGEADFAPTSRTTSDLGGLLRPVSNRYLAGRRLLWQRGCWRAVLAADVAILEINPRMLSSWVLMALRRALGRPTVLWGHAWPRAGRDARTDRLRGAMRRFADVLVVYTETERRELSERSPGTRVFAAPNALYRARDMQPVPPMPGAPPAFVSVGRLVPLKKPGLLVDAFLAARPSLPDGTTLTFVGEGPLRGELEARAASANAAVRFLGQVDDLGRLRDAFAPAVASVSPGAVGLSIVQSTAFGVPMIVARDEPHGPEIEAARDGDNGILVGSDDPAALAAAMARVAAERDRWLARRDEISADCAARYSAEAMAERMLEAIEAAAAARRG
jgi:glycosyltransferase involved in cell wall biosynthesis